MKSECTIQNVILYFMVATLALMLMGCVAVRKVNRVAYEPYPRAAGEVPVMPAANPQVRPPQRPSDGSLWSPDQSGNLFADDKAFRRGDIVLVKVIQKTLGTKKATTDTKRSASISAKIKYFLGLEDDVNNLTNYTNKAADGTQGEWEPNDLINAQSTRAYKGEGSTERSDSLQATVSAIVTDVLTNGNLVVYGHQTVQLNNEASVLTVQGIVRPSDINYDNTIDSTRLANANIQFTGNGSLADAQHPGWAMRVFDFVWPF